MHWYSRQSSAHTENGRNSLREEYCTNMGVYLFIICSKPFWQYIWRVPKLQTKTKKRGENQKNEDSVSRTVLSEENVLSSSTKFSHTNTHTKKNYETKWHNHTIVISEPFHDKWWEFLNSRHPRFSVSRLLLFEAVYKKWLAATIREMVRVRGKRHCQVKLSVVVVVVVVLLL